MIIKSLLSRIRRRISQRKLIQLLASQGIEINLPFCGNINQVEFTPPIYIGPGAWLNLAGKLYIGAGTIIGPGIKVLTANHNWKGMMLPYDDLDEVKDVVIGENVWIGMDVTLLPGVEIGEGAVIAACSCVTKNVPPMALVGGNPARVIKYRDENTYNELKKEKQIYLDLKRSGKTKVGRDRFKIVKQRIADTD